MKKSIWIFLLAVLLPSIVLGWLALRSADEQQIILENRTAALYQKETENTAVTVRSLIDDQRRAFDDVVRQLLAKNDPQKLADNFSTELAKAWPRKAIGFSLGAAGNLCATPPQRAKSNPVWEKFLLGNSSFLAGTTPATVYWVAGDELTKPEQFRRSKNSSDLSQGMTANNAVITPQETQAAVPFQSAAPMQPQSKAATYSKQLPNSARGQAAQSPPLPPAAKSQDNKDQKFATNAGVPPQSPERAAEDKSAATDATRQEPNEPPKEAPMRNVAPQWMMDDNNKKAAVSQFTTTTTDFRALTEGMNEGVVTRFVQDQLDIIFWLRPAQAPGLVFGCLIEADDLHDLWPNALSSTEASGADSSSNGRPAEFVLALLDDKARPVVTQPLGVKGRDWKHPFVASEIGEALPHWEAALYLQRPEQLRESAQLVRRTVIFLIAAALAVIACGGWLVVADARRQLALAQQKTDFVSNVSHELKTPLTSIRMFAELMQNGNGGSTEKYPQYLRIIMVEAERLTRLINNVLDFARLERKQKQFDKKPLDLRSVVERTWEGHALHLQESGFTTRWQAAPGPYPVIGDEDALAQILVNLLSNAEKYAGERKEVELHSYLDGGHACVSVLDRGIGVPPGDERKIFESFYRAHDSLSSGIQGSGLGLTLAQQLAREHGGEILYQPRLEGGSNFTLRVPVAGKGKVDS
ncbi:integral membrane sensor signal transduction histidine kinase [Chthoniobacter flavus Ellin428]|uniref:histidine kinase n=1 Tax=Chthoniobacter flavus Ellin428 TaxID=497964 RepID=B4DAL2_9BACT|nr:HAMP domain-containing sensor histidine kinase [Chthoniobacter flavus]EDY16530.1 integral membrane sensor signal transduction histidine kinase [Chthoniobacter flavus Ellin428]TCO85212.1 signal transduction histidine kinase [Chthoniobacter flavus]